MHAHTHNSSIKSKMKVPTSNLHDGVWVPDCLFSLNQQWVQWICWLRGIHSEPWIGILALNRFFFLVEMYKVILNNFKNTHGHFKAIRGPLNCPFLGKGDPRERHLRSCSSPLLMWQREDGHWGSLSSGLFSGSCLRSTDNQDGAAD